MPRTRWSIGPTGFAAMLLATALVACSADRAELQPITTTTPTVPVPATASAAPVRTTTTTTTVAAPVGFAHCRVTAQGCVVEDPSPADVTAVELVLTPPPNLASLQYGPRPEQLADVYLPRGGPAPLAIVYLHAGGWMAGGRADVPTTILHELDAHRAVISVGYRLTTEGPWPAQIQDVDRAIRWVKLHAADWGLDSRRVVVAGGSAGGHLALFAAVAPGHLPAADLPPELRAIDPKVAGVVSFAAPADIASLLDHEWGPALLERLIGCSRNCDAATLADASPSSHVTAAAPPLYIAGGLHDTLVPPDVNVLALTALWASMIGPQAVWVDVVDNQAHNIDVNGVNVTALDEFLANLVPG